MVVAGRMARHILVRTARSSVFEIACFRDFEHFGRVGGLFGGVRYRWHKDYAEQQPEQDQQ